jgi:hypothetical protein
MFSRGSAPSCTDIGAAIGARGRTLGSASAAETFLRDIFGGIHSPSGDAGLAGLRQYPQIQLRGFPPLRGVPRCQPAFSPPTLHRETFVIAEDRS